VRQPPGFLESVVEAGFMKASVAVRRAGGLVLPSHRAYGFFGVWYSASLWNGFHTVS
jgi:hypothetical protein